MNVYTVMVGDTPLAMCSTAELAALILDMARKSAPMATLRLWVRAR